MRSLVLIFIAMSGCGLSNQSAREVARSAQGEAADAKLRIKTVEDRVGQIEDRQRTQEKIVTEFAIDRAAALEKRLDELEVQVATCNSSVEYMRIRISGK